MTADLAPVEGEKKVEVMQAFDLHRHYTSRRGLWQKQVVVKALNGVTFSLNQGATIGIVGESGCGKSTLARILVMIDKPSCGELFLQGVDIFHADEQQIANARKQVQMVFQNPYASLNPRKTIAQALEEPLIVNTDLSRSDRLEKIGVVMQLVGLLPEYMHRYPHMFSGGQRQRVAIARAMILDPCVVIADEPVSALDVSIQAQILNLFMDLQENMKTAYIFISHDLSVVRHIADELLVMYLGAMVEYGAKNLIYENPLHPYTMTLLSATPKIRGKGQEKKEARIRAKGELPSPLNIPPGCTFHTRCPFAKAHCKLHVPEFREVLGRKVACHEAENIQKELHSA